MDSHQFTAEKIAGMGNFLTHPDLSFPLSLDRSRAENFKVYEIIPDNTILFDARDKTQLGLQKIGLFYHAILVKQHIDTPQAVSQISQKLHIPTDWIGYAGLKDAHAITHQRISIFNIDLKDSPNIKLPRCQLNGFVQQRYAIKLGDLLGNYFTISLHWTDQNYTPNQSTWKHLTAFITTLNRQGFPNYFGLQRFGTQRPISGIMGRLLLLQQWEAAVKIYLMASSQQEQQTISKQRQILYDTEDYQQFLTHMPKSYVYERSMAKLLQRFPNNYFRALNQLPKTILRLFVSSYQSYVFNTLVTSCLQRQQDTKELPKMLPLIGAETDLTRFSPTIQNQVMSILQRDGITLQHFRSSIPWLNQKGSIRATIITALPVKQGIQLQSLPHQQGIILAFGLPKGSYATMLIREIIKSQDQIQASQLSVSETRSKLETGAKSELQSAIDSKVDHATPKHQELLKFLKLPNTSGDIKRIFNFALDFSAVD